MKKTLRYILLFIAATMAAACSNEGKVIFDQTVSFENEKWLRQDNKIFNIDVNNVEDCYNINVKLKIDTSMVRGDQLPLIIDLYSENGERRNWRSFVKLRTKEGNWLCPIEGKYAVADQRIKDYFFFNSKGTHRLEIHHGTDRYEIYGVNEMGVRVVTAKLEYPE